MAKVAPSESPIISGLGVASSGEIASSGEVAHLLRELEARRRPAMVHLITDWGTARVWFGEPGLLGAELGVLTGEAAVYRILGIEVGTFVVSEHIPESRREIHASVDSLISKIAIPEEQLAGEELTETSYRDFSFDEIPIPVRPPPREPMSDEERTILSLIDGRRSLYDIVAACGDPRIALIIIFRLHDDGFFRFLSALTKAPEPAQDEDLAPLMAGTIRMFDAAESLVATIAKSAERLNERLATFTLEEGHGVG